MNRKLSVAVLLAAVTMLGFVASAGAVDGVIEINQAKVMAAGGFPYVITSTGSYRLTSNLTVSAASTDAIDVNAPSVTIDLNGFSIFSFVATSANAISGNYGGITVENGTVTGFGRGVSLSSQSIVRNVHADSNSNVGIGVVSSSVVQGCTANGNGNYGIVGSGSGDVISGNTANGNGGVGVGIDALGNGSLVAGNTAVVNSGFGLYLGSNTGYRENVMLDNTPNVGGTGTSMGNNLCNGVIC
jgi:Periplasmic copper-binding protein (NosD)